MSGTTLRAPAAPAMRCRWGSARLWQPDGATQPAVAQRTRRHPPAARRTHDKTHDVARLGPSERGASRTSTRDARTYPPIH